MVRVTKGGSPIENEPGDGKTPQGKTLLDRVAFVIDRIRPAVQSDGGDIELLDVSPQGVVKIRMHGACVGCPSSNMTLRMGIEQNLKEYIPEVTQVQAIENDA